MLLNSPDSSTHLLAMIVAPAIAYSLPWILLRYLPEERRKKRLPAMLGASFPVVVLMILAGTFLMPQWRRGAAQDTVHDSTRRERMTGDWASLFLRVGIISGGAFGSIWLIGIAGERLTRDRREDEVKETEEAASDKRGASHASS